MENLNIFEVEYFVYYWSNNTCRFNSGPLFIKGLCPIRNSTLLPDILALPTVLYLLLPPPLPLRPPPSSTHSPPPPSTHTSPVFCSLVLSSTDTLNRSTFSRRSLILILGPIQLIPSIPRYWIFTQYLSLDQFSSSHQYLNTEYIYPILIFGPVQLIPSLPRYRIY